MHVSVIKDSIHSVFIDKCVGSRWLTLDIAVGHTQFAHASAQELIMELDEIKRLGYGSDTGWSE